MEIAVRRQIRNLVSDLTQDTKVNTGVLQLAVSVSVSFDLSPLSVDPLFSLELQVLALYIGNLEFIFCFLVNFRESCLRDSMVYQFFAVNVAHGIHIFYDCIHERLSESGLIEFVMTHLTVSNQVDDDIGAKLLTVLSGNSKSVCH